MANAKFQTRTDNHSPAAKLDLRRHFLKKMRDAGEPIRVMDCFQGSKLIWGQLETEFQIASYWGVDLKEKKGRIKIDSSRILEQEGWNQNVIDLDAYGSPWKHWRNLITTCRHNVTAFMTIGMVRMGGGNLDNAANALMGVVFQRMKIPASMGPKISSRALPHALATAEYFKLFPVEIIEAFPQQNCRYIGVRLEYRPEKSESKTPTITDSSCEPQK
jgi:hypothetical protein